MVTDKSNSLSQSIRVQRCVQLCLIVCQHTFLMTIFAVDLEPVFSASKGACCVLKIESTSCHRGGATVTQAVVVATFSLLFQCAFFLAVSSSPLWSARFLTHFTLPLPKRNQVCFLQAYLAHYLLDYPRPFCRAILIPLTCLLLLLKHSSQRTLIVCRQTSKTLKLSVSNTTACLVVMVQSSALHLC